MVIDVRPFRSLFPRWPLYLLPGLRLGQRRSSQLVPRTPANHSPLERDDACIDAIENNERSTDHEERSTIVDILLDDGDGFGRSAPPEQGTGQGIATVFAERRCGTCLAIS